jgi:hypothetical protein
MTEKQSLVRPDISENFIVRAMTVIEDVFGGEHHVGPIKWKGGLWGSCSFTTHESQLSTFDFSHLTRLVVRAHDQCLRAAVSGGGPRRLKILLSERKLDASDPLTGGCPTLEAHVSAIRKGGTRAMQELYDSMRIESCPAT